MMEEETTIIYILKLTDNKYYIGKTNNLDKRLNEHFDGQGSEWCKLYKPVEILEFYTDCDYFDEDKYTIKAMEKYGIKNVRGGSFSKIKLEESDLKTISKMINGAKNKCFFCGKEDHFINNCPDNKKNNPSFLEKIFGKNFLNYIKNIFQTEKKHKNRKFCSRCGRNGHLKKNCYAKTNKKGNKI
jgi:predicted GIY-YIG superfamily endonuclease